MAATKAIQSPQTARQVIISIQPGCREIYNDGRELPDISLSLSARPFDPDLLTTTAPLPVRLPDDGERRNPKWQGSTCLGTEEAVCKSFPAVALACAIKSGQPEAWLKTNIVDEAILATGAGCWPQHGGFRLYWCSSFEIHPTLPAAVTQQAEEWWHKGNIIAQSIQDEKGRDFLRSEEGTRLAKEQWLAS